MANKKFDYSEDMAQRERTPQGGNNDREELRRRRLEQRKNALANEFRDLKPEIGRTYNLLCNLVEKSGVLSETMLPLLELLKTALPLRLADDDRKALRDGLHGIADNAVSKIRNERERAEDEVRKNDSRVSIPQAIFWCMVVLLLLLAMFFALVLFANVKLLHSGILAELTVIYSILIAIALTASALIFYRQNH